MGADADSETRRGDHQTVLHCIYLRRRSASVVVLAANPAREDGHDRIPQADYPDSSVEREVFDDIDANVVEGHATTEGELVELASGADALIVEYAEVTEDVLDALDGLRVVSR